MGLRTRILVVSNPSSGLNQEGEKSDAIQDLLRSAGVAEVKVILLGQVPDAASAIRQHIQKGVDAVVAAGGDGTVSFVASVLAHSPTPLGVLPVGTLNHFAKDLGIPTDLPSAAEVIAAGKLIKVDVGKVNDRLFINNSSIGIYPAMVRERERLMARGWPKRLAMAASAVTVLREFPNISIRLTTGETGVVTRTPLVFVGNNEYEFSGRDAGSRKGLQDGLLQVCTVKDSRRVALFQMVLAATIGNTENASGLHMTTAKNALIKTLRKHVRVAIDGEVFMMRSPLRYEIDPAALIVIAPREN